MRDDFACDIGDFGKYGLLRYLSGATGLTLGILWMMTRSSGAVGRNRDYLDDPAGNQQVASCDRVLFDALAELKNQGRCSLDAIERSAILPHGTLYHTEPLDDFPFKGSAAPVPGRRDLWFDAAVRSLAPAGLVLLDPDTGLEVPSISRHRSGNARYVYYEELTSFWNQDQSLLVYHHLPRRAAGAEIDQRGRDVPGSERFFK